MTVNLQIIGIYYKNDLSVDFSKGKVTPKDVLDNALLNPIKDGSGQPITWLSYAYAQVGPGSQSPVGNYVDFIAATYANPTPPSIGGNSYVPGTYGLAQTFTGLGSITYSVWQYYIRDRDQKPVPITPSEAPFNSDESRVIEDGFTLIWRLVSICGGQRVPNTNSLVAGTSSPNLNARLDRLITRSAEKAST